MYILIYCLFSPTTSLLKTVLVFFIINILLQARRQWQNGNGITSYTKAPGFNSQPSQDDHYLAISAPGPLSPWKGVFGVALGE